MIKRKSYASFAKKRSEKQSGFYPYSAQLELTYRCNLNCVHCYCKGSEGGNELTTKEWKGLIDQLYSADVSRLTFTGGEPLIREDFFNIYRHAKKKGFLINIFTNATLLDSKAIRCLLKYPPSSIEVSLYGVSKAIYESITQKKGSFKALMQNVREMAAEGLPLVFKTVGLKQNRDAIQDIKDFSESLLGKKRFKFDSFIIPRLSGEKTPCLYRLSPEEILEREESDPDMRSHRRDEFKRHIPLLRKPQYKYHCNAWFKHFYITPYARLRFCHLTDKYSSDLKRTSFLEGFYNGFPAILNETYKTDTRCKLCRLREFCFHCPPRAYLETGDEEAPVDYYCRLAKMQKARIEKSKSVTSSNSLPYERR